MQNREISMKVNMLQNARACRLDVRTCRTKLSTHMFKFCILICTHVSSISGQRRKQTREFVEKMWTCILKFPLIENIYKCVDWYLHKYNDKGVQRCNPTCNHSHFCYVSPFSGTTTTDYNLSNRLLRLHKCALCSTKWICALILATLYTLSLYN